MAAFNQRDLEELLALVDPGIEFYAPFTASSVARQSSYQGHDGIRQYFDDVAAVWARLEVIPKEFRSANDHVVSFGAIVGERGGEQINDEVAWAWRLRDGKVVWGRVYLTPDEALEDTGIK